MLTEPRLLAGHELADESILTMPEGAIAEIRQFLMLDATTAEYQAFTPQQRATAIGATALTLMRPVARVWVEHHHDQFSPLQRTVFGAVLDLIDRLDGELSRQFEATTSLGAVLDPLCDKLDFIIQEIYRLDRGDIDAFTVIIRLLRDIASTLARHEATKQASLNPESGASPKSGIAGKLTTTLRSVSLRVGDTEAAPTTARILRHLATIGLAVSLLENRRNYRSTRSEVVESSITVAQTP